MDASNDQLIPRQEAGELLRHAEHVEGLLVESAGPRDAQPVLVIHGGLPSEGCRPLLAQSSLCDHYRLIHYYRRGHAGSRVPRPGFDIADQVGDACGVLAALGTAPVHVIGHSVGVPIALQLALDHPELVRTVVAVEPAFVSRPQLGPWFEWVLTPVVTAYLAGDRAGAAARLLRLLDGPDYEEKFGATLGRGWQDRAGTALHGCLAVDFPGSMSWRLPPARAACIRQPALVLSGSNTLAQFACIADDLAAWLPAVSTAVVVGATHNVFGCQPESAAAAIARFLAAHQDSDVTDAA